MTPVVGRGGELKGNELPRSAENFGLILQDLGLSRVRIEVIRTISPTFLKFLGDERAWLELA